MGEGVAVTPPVASQAVVELAAEATVPNLPPGKAGWFPIFDASKKVLTTMLPDGRCVGSLHGSRWIITPKNGVGDANPTPCNGDATALSSTTMVASSPHAFGKRVVYQEFRRLWISDSPEGDVKALTPPFGEANDMTVAGTALLVSTEDHPRKLFRYDGSAWTEIPLDGGEVRSFAGTSSGRAYAVTSKNALYESTDSGASWKKRPHQFQELMHATVQRVDPGLAARGRVFISGTGRPAGGKPGAYGNAELPDDVEIREFASTIRPVFPEGVTNVDGVLLTSERTAVESMKAGRNCGYTTVFGQRGAAVCVDDNGVFIVATDDLGGTVREIYRDSQPADVRGIARSEREIFVRLGCMERAGHSCAEERGFLLEATDQGWQRRKLELPSIVELPFTLFDRRGDGGFFLFSQVTTGGAKDVSVAVGLLHTRRGSVAARPLSPALAGALPGDDSTRAVLGASVDDDGGVGMFVVRRARTGEPQAFGYVKVSEQMDVVESRAVDLGQASSSLRGQLQVGVAGRKIIVLHGNKLVVSEDAGKTFATFDAPRSLLGAQWAMKCGSAGCDFAGFSEADFRPAWRWGTKPLAETLSSAR